MIPLSLLLDKLAHTEGLSTQNPHQSERMINRVALLQSSTLPDEETLYLCKDRAVLKSRALAQKLSVLPRPCLILTDKNPDCDFPLILTPRIPSVDALLEVIWHLIRFEDRMQYEANALYHLLYRGRGIDELVDRAEQFLGRAVSVLDASYTMIAVSPLMKVMPFGVERSEAGYFLSPQEVESLRRLQIEQQIYQHTQAFCISTEDHPDTNWIFCAIRIQHVMSGYVAVCLPDLATATEHELRLTTIFADICAIQMQKHDFLVHRTGLQYETFFSDLIEGRFTSLPMIESRFRMLNRNLGKFFCIAVLYCAQPHNSELFNNHQMASLRKSYPGSVSVVYQNNIVLLLNQDQPVLLNEDTTAALARFARRNQLKVSLSQPFADILKINIFYEQAIHTLELSDLRSADQVLFFSTEALPNYLFSKCSYAELETGIHHHIFQLQDYDREYHTEFVATLRALLDNDRNAARAAEALHIHRSTFFYRIKKMEELLGISMTDSHLLFLYELSLKIWDYLSR